jgi:hypothetical protein
MQKCYVLAEEKLDSIGAQMEISPRKCFSYFGCLIWASKASAPKVTKLIKLCLCKIRAITQLIPLAWEAGGKYFKNQ